MGYRFKQTSFLDLANISRKFTSFIQIATFLMQSLFSNTIISTLHKQHLYSRFTRTISKQLTLASISLSNLKIANISKKNPFQPFSLALGSDVYESADTNEHLQAQPYVTLMQTFIFKKKHHISHFQHQQGKDTYIIHHFQIQNLFHAIKPLHVYAPLGGVSDL